MFVEGVPAMDMQVGLSGTQLGLAVGLNMQYRAARRATGRHHRMGERHAASSLPPASLQ